MALELLDRDGYTELRLYGKLDGQSADLPALAQRFADVRRLLVDARDVEQVTADVMWIAGIAARALALGTFRAAVVATDDVVYGTLRQAAAYGAEDHDGGFAFFRERDEALSWLLLPG